VTKILGPVQWLQSSDYLSCPIASCRDSQ